jgi:hypothetical protein
MCHGRKGKDMKRMINRCAVSRLCENCSGNLDTCPAFYQEFRPEGGSVFYIIDGKKFIPTRGDEIARKLLDVIQLDDRT